MAMHVRMCFGNLLQAEERAVEKACVVCGNSFPLRFYQRLKHAKDGHFAQCRGCVYEDKQRRR